MGMAASQARYLSLTARKTNTEYQGQQVNQERTALANQSAGLFNQMLSLEVPTPPVATDYTKTYYTYVNPANSETVTIDNITIDDERTAQGSGSIYASISITEKYSILQASSVLFDTQAGGINSIIECFEPTGESLNYTASINGQGRYTITGPSPNRAMTEKFNAAAKEAGGTDTEYTDNICYYSFTVPSTGIVYYIPAGEGTYDESGNFVRPTVTPTELLAQAGANGINILATESATKTESDTKNAILNTANDGTGRYESVSILDDVTGEIVATYNLTQQTVQDDEAYDAAMATYNAKKAIYDKQVADINAETTVIQQQDKTLELHLDQLDTEQQAIQTEMDAVKKVIDKNIEETFKTFA